MTDFIDNPRKIRKGEELDPEKIRQYLLDKIPGLSGEISIEQFPSGYSNLTYFIKVGDQEMVLRRPPFGSKVKTAHDMGREWRIFTSLHPVWPKVPKPLVFCDDESVIGAKFYVMERIKGIILRRALPQGMDFSPETAANLSKSFVKNLAELHSLDYEKIGMGTLGKPEGYLSRQVNGWADRYTGSQTDDIPEIIRDIDWLKKNIPQSPAPTLVHGDYKYGNLVLDPHDISKIIGVLDWEMATIGDPLVDLGIALGYWVNHDDSDALRLAAFGPTFAPGSFTRRELADLYAQITGRDVSNISYYVIFALFKIAVIVQQIYYRYVKGHTSDERFKPLILMVVLLSRTAEEMIQKGKI
jgi:aminoglycoside phosphotransferase (APT) family kinase protein